MTTAVDLHGLDALVARGAVVVDVLPPPTYAAEHIPGARNIPLTVLDAEATRGLDPASPVVVYCFDYQCDLSPRAAARLESLGFREVSDFVAGRAAWTADGRPTEGAVGDRERILPRVRRDVPRLALHDTVTDMAEQLDRDRLEHVLVTTYAGCLIGLLRRSDLDDDR